MIKFKLMSPDAQKPTKFSADASGFDLVSAEDTTLWPGKWEAVGTGLQLDLSLTPPTIDVQIRPRSGMAFKHGVTVLNSPGTIDRDYLGEVKVILINHGDTPYVIKKGDRIAQMVFGLRMVDPTFFPVEKVEIETARSNGGFGSTGV